MNNILLEKIKNRKNISDLWFDLLKKVLATKKEVIVEVAPGYKSKIGLALAKMNFKGTIHVIEPNESALKFIVEDYSKIMPFAKIIGHNKMLHEFLFSDIPEKFILLSNHPFDDMILSSCIGKNKSKSFFKDNENWIMDLKKYWNNFGQKKIESGINSTVVKVINFIQKFKPAIVIMSHYDAGLLTVNNVTLPNKVGNLAVNKIKKQLKIKTPTWFEKIITSYGYEKNWIIIK